MSTPLITYSNVPQVSDWATYLTNAGLSVSASAAPTISAAALAALIEGGQGYLQAGIEAFERDTDYHPFLGDASDTTRFYDPPGPEKRHSGYSLYMRGGGKILEIDGGLLSVTTLTAGLTYDDTGAAQGGTVKVPNRDFVLRPDNAPAQNRPYEWIEFFFRLYGMARSISVLGKFGFQATVPADAWRAMLHAAFLEARAEISSYVHSGILEWKQGPVSVKYRDGYKGGFPAAQLAFNRAVMRYQREEMGL